jgi:hypothetical protein
VLRHAGSAAFAGKVWIILESFEVRGRLLLIKEGAFEAPPVLKFSLFYLTPNL